MPIGIDSILLLIHVLFFCFWLGTDIGVFYSSRYVLQADIGIEARRYCLKIMNFLDQLPRVSMIGITVIGFTLGILRGYFTIDPIWILPIWLIGVPWIGVVLYLYINEHHPEKIAGVKRADYRFRILMILVITTLAVTSLAGVGITADRWLALKLLILAAIMSCGVLMRRAMRTFPQYFGPMMQGTATPEQTRTAQAMMAGAKRYVLMIYALLVIAAALGLWKPV
jgi:hypothetical protein